MITLFKDPFFQGFDDILESTKFLKTPETKVIKTETEYSISVSVPGLTKEDLKISTKDGILKISFEKAKGGDIDFAKINELAFNIKKRVVGLKKVE